MNIKNSSYRSLGTPFKAGAISEYLKNKNSFEERQKKYREELYLNLAKQSNKYPDNEAYTKLRTQYGDNLAYAEFFEKVQMEGNGFIIGNVKYSTLSATPNNETIISGDHLDQYNKQGRKNVIYMTADEAARESATQHKKLLTPSQLIDLSIVFPGKSKADRLIAVMNLFGLDSPGWYSISSHQWVKVGVSGQAWLFTDARTLSLHPTRRKIISRKIDKPHIDMTHALHTSIFPVLVRQEL